MDKLKQQIRDILEQPLAMEDCHIADIVLSKYKNNSTLRQLRGKLARILPQYPDYGAVQVRLDAALD